MRKENHLKKTPAMTQDMLEQAARQFKVLSDPLRLKILRCLLSGVKTGNEIQDLVGTSQPNISKHLSILVQASFISRTKEGVTALYEIADPTVFKLCDLVCKNTNN